MLIVLVLLTIIVLIIPFAGRRKKKRGPIKMTTQPRGRETAHITIKLDEKDIVQGLRSGSLPLSEEGIEITIKAITNFYGVVRASDNNQYFVSFCDGHYENERWINGMIALVKNGTVLFKKTLQRPNECDVSNDGTVVCCDWLNMGLLEGAFMVFSSSGERLFTHNASANLGASAISPESSIGVFETLCSETTDADSLFIVDIREKKVIHQFPRPCAFNRIKINTNSRTLSLIDHEGFTFQVDFEGNQTNKAELEREILTRGSIVKKLRLYESRPDDLRLRDEKYVDLLTKALRDKDATYSYGEDWLCRRLGECYQAIGNTPKTIHYWEKAVQLNPKVGIKRKLEALKRHL